jgi:hypothetical protein
MKQLSYEQVENFMVRSSLAVSAKPGFFVRLDVVATSNGVFYEVVENDHIIFKGRTLFQAMQAYNRMV